MRSSNDVIETSSARRRPAVERKAWLAAAAAALGAVAASTCCIVPLVLFTLGVGGAWIGVLTGLAVYKWYIFAATALCLAIGFRLVYRPPAFAHGACASRAAARSTRVALWASTALVVAAVVLPYASLWLV